MQLINERVNVYIPSIPHCKLIKVFDTDDESLIDSPQRKSSRPPVAKAPPYKVKEPSKTLRVIHRAFEKGNRLGSARFVPSADP